MGKDNDLESLNKLENQAKGKESEPSLIDGYIVIERDDLPHEGILFPPSWCFAYRSPLAKEVANFSVIQDGDNPAVVNAVEELIKKCIVIYDTDMESTIPSAKIPDAYRTFFILKLRDAYLKNQPVEYGQVCSDCHKPMQVKLTSKSLQYTEIAEDLLEAFDGKRFKLDMGDDDIIEFLIPTIEFTSRLFKYIVKVFKDSQKNPEKKTDNIVYDKQFLLLAPYLCVLGNETIKEISNKFHEIQKNDELYNKYLIIASKLNLAHSDSFDYKCEHCESLEEALIKFPGGWRNLFIANSNTVKKYFN